MTNKSPYPRLFEPAYISDIKLRNRVVMLPMGTAYANLTGEVSLKTIAHYEERARGGVGLVIVGNISPHTPNAINQLVLNCDGMMMGHYELVEKVRAQGSKIVAQLNFAGRQKYTDARSAEELVSSSPLPTTLLSEVYPKPRELTREEIYQFIELFARAAERAKRVGYDMVEIHGAHGYLINQFMSPFMNKRTDEFGGSMEGRMRFPLLLIKGVRTAVGQDFPVGIRISADEFVPGGVTLKESTAMAGLLQDAGVAYISVTGSIFETMHKMEDLMRDSEGWKEYLWEGIKKAVKVPVIAGGGLRHPDFCERVLEEGKADFIGIARPLLADPEWPTKAEEGRAEDIRYCISCNECLFGSAARRRGGGARRCTVNACCGREIDFARIIPARTPKKVMVIGGGPGGMETARIAALRGHEVTLYEKDDELGGQLRIAGRIQTKSKLLWLIEYLVTQLEKLGVLVKLGTKVTPEMVEKTKPDAVVVATGAEPIVPPITGIECDHVVNGWHLLQERTRLSNKRVAVVGGGMIGCEVAEYLLEFQNTVTIIEQLSSVASDMEPINRVGLLEMLAEKNVVLLTGRKVVGITEKGVQTLNLDNGNDEVVVADNVVVAVGSKPVNSLMSSLEGKVATLLSAGDCNRPRVIMEAIYEGSLVGRQI